MDHADLDEAQGLTLEMVASWIASKGWIPEEKREDMQWWVSPQPMMGNKGLWVPTYEKLAAQPLRYIAARYELSIQAILREMNPRLRPGWPSDEALAAHPRAWLVSIKDRDKVETLSAAVLSEWKATARFSVRCWPCDRYAQRVRWPEKNGVML